MERLMADFETGDVVRLGCVMELESLHDVVNVLYQKIVSGGGMDFAQAALDLSEYADQLYLLIAARQTDLLDEKHIAVKNMTQGTVWGNIAWGAYGGGVNGSDATTPQVACLAYGRTPISRVQIRKYLGIFTQADLTDGVWDSPVTSVCDDFIGEHITEQTMTEGLVLKGCAYRLSDGRVTFAVSPSTSAHPVIQRRRRRGRGS